MKTKILFPVEAPGDLSRLEEVARLAREVASPDLALVVGCRNGSAELVNETLGDGGADMVYAFGDQEDVGMRLLLAQRFDQDAWLLPMGSGLLPQSDRALAGVIAFLRALDRLPGAEDVLAVSAPYEVRFLDEPTDTERRAVNEAYAGQAAILAVRSRAVDEAGELAVGPDDVVHFPRPQLAMLRFATTSDLMAEVSGG